MLARGLGELTWRCHVCKEERPDDKISVCKVPFKASYCSGVQNVRYCNDRADCRRAAPNVDFFKRFPEETACE